jgi:hypothetical protein
MKLKLKLPTLNAFNVSASAKTSHVMTPTFLHTFYKMKGLLIEKE